MTSTIAAATTPGATATADSSSLLKKSLKDLKAMCSAAGTPVTGNKAKLVERLLDPASHQRKKAKPSGIKKKAITTKPYKPHYHALATLTYGGFGGGYGGGYGGGFGYGSEDDDEDYDECEVCGERGEPGSVDPHTGVCYDCTDSLRKPGGCPCWRGNCEFFPDDGCFMCEM